MRKRSTLILAILASSLAPCLRAQDPSPEQLRARAKERDIKQEELVNLEKETARALQGNNAGLFRRIYGDDFVAILPSGQCWTRPHGSRPSRIPASSTDRLTPRISGCGCFRRRPWSLVSGVRTEPTTDIHFRGSCVLPTCISTANAAGKPSPARKRFCPASLRLSRIAGHDQ
jgi:hypothetical protein